MTYLKRVALTHNHMLGSDRIVLAWQQMVKLLISLVFSCLLSKRLALLEL